MLGASCSRPLSPSLVLGPPALVSVRCWDAQVGFWVTGSCLGRDVASAIIKIKLGGEEARRKGKT